MARFETHRWIAATAGKRLWLVALLCLIQGALAVNGVVYALLMRDTVDAAVAGVSNEFWVALASFAGVILLQVALNAVNRYAVERTRISVENRMRDWAFAAILRQDVRTAGSRHSGDLMTRLTSDAVAVTTGVVGFIPAVVSMGVRVACVFAAMLALVPQLALVFLALGCVLGVASLGLRGVMKRLHKRQQEAEGSMRSYLQECLESLLIIRAFGVGDKVRGANLQNMGGYRKARLARANVSNVGNAGLSLAIQGGYILGFAWCGFGILQGTVSYGTLIAVIQLISQIQSPFAQVGGVFSQYSAMLASAERLMELEGRDGVSDSGGASEKAPISSAAAQELYERLAAIRFDGVSFGYGDDMVLDGFTAAVPRGSFAAIAGSSGIGKSTLMKLLLGVYEPSGGGVFLEVQDGSRIATADVPSGMFAYVPQGNHLMSGTIREAVTFAGMGDRVDEASLREACRVACALEFVEALPDGFDTVLGEKGAGLSEGQMQRLAVARAVYSGAPVLLLDEATSALDDETEREMLSRLKSLPDRTVIAITHRLEALRICDQAITLENQASGSCR